MTFTGAAMARINCLREFDRSISLRIIVGGTIALVGISIAFIARNIFAADVDTWGTILAISLAIEIALFLPHLFALFLLPLFSDRRNPLDNSESKR